MPNNELIIDKVLRIDAELIANTTLEAEFDSNEMYIECGFEVGAGARLPYYKGETEVIPKAYDETILHTKNQSMDSDIKVLVIPTEEVSNLYGTTFAIAREGIEINV